jgi:hypothetical protein
MNHKKKPYLNLQKFEELFLEFIEIPTWTAKKHDARNTFSRYLEDFMVTSIRVAPGSKYNYCDRTDSFTILRVPSAVRGKLVPFSGELVLIRCSSVGGAWSQYLNEVYLLERELTADDHKRLKHLFKNYYIRK